MMITRHASLLCITLAIMAIACDKKEDSTPSKQPVEEPTDDTGAGTPPTDEVKEDEHSAESQPVAPPVDEDDIPMEVDPSATDGLEAIDYTGKILKEDDQIKDSYKGKVLKSVSWQDKYGTSAFLITSTPRNKKTGGGMLVATHLTRSGDGSWETIREYKELIKECEFDLILEPMLEEPWALTDLDKDGLAEVTFTWRADCVSDVSAAPYKVLIDEHGDKYALRGTTKIILTKEDNHGGTYDIGKEFDKAPKGFLKHAEMVWANTHITDYTQP